MKYYSLVKNILRNDIKIESYDIVVDTSEDFVNRILNECTKYEYNLRRTMPYGMDHPGGIVAVSYTIGLNKSKYEVIERECDEYLTEYAIDKAAIANENERLLNLLLNSRAKSKISAYKEYTLLNRFFTR